jgi:hypothetical protein
MKMGGNIHNLLLLMAFISVFGACKKSTPPANAKFSGFYAGESALKGTSNSYYPARIRVLASGTISNQITVLDSFFSQQYVGIVKGDSINFIGGSMFPGQSICGTPAFTGMGNLADSLLTFKIYRSFFCDGATNVDSLFFGGIRK